MIKKELKYSYNDVSIVPAKVSGIDHRIECNVTRLRDSGIEYLPLFTAPMTSVVNEENFNLFKSNGIIPILPRSVDLRTRLLNLDGWSAYSLKEISDVFLSNSSSENPSKLLIDIANGHMNALYETVMLLRNKFGYNLKIM